MRRFFLEDGGIDLGAIVLRGDPAHHLMHVLRLQPGDTVVVFDGTGRELACVLREAFKDEAHLSPIEPVRTVAETPSIHLLIALTKGPAMDSAVRMATEAGVTHIHPLLTARSVARGERTDRWERIAVSAAQQSRRPTVPEVAPIVDIEAGIRAIPTSYDRRIATPGGPRQGAPAGPSAVLIGPEGGLSPYESDLAQAIGFTPQGLGRFILRVETAAAVAVALLAP